MTNKTYNLQSLSEDELKNILESLLFSSSVDVCASWYKENSLTSIELAKKIRLMFPEIVLENVYIYDDEKIVLNDEFSKEILEYFPELKKDFTELEPK
jgi:hypothetical protein